MVTDMKFGAAARHDYHKPFEVKGHELHVFFAPDCKDKTVNVDDFVFADPDPLLGQGTETHEPDMVKTPEDRAYQAQTMAARSGKSKLVVAFDLDDRVASTHFDTVSEAHTVVLDLGGHEAHVHYQKGASKVVEAKNVKFLSVYPGLDTVEGYEPDSELSPEDRAEAAQRYIESRPKTGQTYAVVYCTKRLGREVSADFDEATLARAVNDATGARTVTNDLADAVNAKFNARPGFVGRFLEGLKHMAHAPA